MNYDVYELMMESRTSSGADLGRAIFHSARAALASGESRDRVIDAVTAHCDRFGEDGREEDQDAVAEVLDSLTGFSSPAASL